MGRKAEVIGHDFDIFGDGWDVRERKPTKHGFFMITGWPSGVPRGAGGAGGPRVIMTAQLADHLRKCKGVADTDLPLGETAIKRLRRLLDLHRLDDNRAWWDARRTDLASMSVSDFARKHGAPLASVSRRRAELVGPTNRPNLWWQDPIAAKQIATLPFAIVCDKFGLAPGSVRRLRWKLSQDADAQEPKDAVSPGSNGGNGIEK